MTNANPQNVLSGESTKIIANHLASAIFYISLLYNQNVSWDPIFKDSEVSFTSKILALNVFVKSQRMKILNGLLFKGFFMN